MEVIEIFGVERFHWNWRLARIHPCREEEGWFLVIKGLGDKIFEMSTLRKIF